MKEFNSDESLQYNISGYAGAVMILRYSGESDDDLFERCRVALDKQIKAVVPEKECWRVNFEIKDFGSAGTVDCMDKLVSARWFYSLNQLDESIAQTSADIY